MRNTNKLSMLLGALFFFSSSGLRAQDIPYTSQQLVGKWVLKSANFNGIEVALLKVNDPISFEFTLDGKVTYVYHDGNVKQGNFLVKENRLIDPNTPEYFDADILSLTGEGLVLGMEDDRQKMVMRFEPEVRRVNKKE